MDDATLPPTGDLSIDPTRDTPQILDDVSTNKSEREHETDAPMVMRMGNSVLKCWPTLPRDVQEAVFEGASPDAGEEDRDALARFLHAHGMAKNPTVETPLE